MLAFTSRSMSQIASSECCQTQLTGQQRRAFWYIFLELQDFVAFSEYMISKKQLVTDTDL